MKKVIEKEKTLILNSILVVLTFIVAFYGEGILNSYISFTFSSTFLKVFYSYLFWVVPTLVAGFFEEYFFRGFLFGILFRKLKWGFVPASILGGIIFGIGHLYQSSTLIETIGIFAITTMGAIWFSWLYTEWENNLWVPIFLHILMNLSWILFEVSDNVLGGLYTNFFRIITIALTIIITIRYHKNKGLINLLVNNNS